MSEQTPTTELSSEQITIAQVIIRAERGYRKRPGYYSGEDGGAYCFVKRSEAAQRMTREKAESLLPRIDAYWGPAILEDAETHG